MDFIQCLACVFSVLRHLDGLKEIGKVLSVSSEQW